MSYVRARRLPPVSPVRPIVRHPKPTGPDQDTVIAVLKRAQGRCEVCGELCAGGRGWDWSIHHRRGRQGSRTDNTISNLMLVDGASNVAGCHGYIHQYGHWSQPRGYKLSRFSNIPPAEVPVWIEGRWVLLTAGGYQDVGAP